jgi:predicted acyltransferase
MSKARRDLSLDSFRGLDVLLMIVVNVQGDGKRAYPALVHAEWNGLTFADLVFPVFLLIVGLSTPLALDRPGVGTSWLGIVRRSILLFAIGVGLSLMIRPTLDPDMIRWTGVLQRIGIVYLVCAAVVMIRRGISLAVALSVGLLALHSYMLLRVGSPPSMEPGMGISGWLDQNFIPGRVLHKTWEPEGILSTLPAIVNGLIGVAVMRWRQVKNVGPWRVALVGAGLLGAGLVLVPMLPINKNLWTASFALVTCGGGIVVWSLMRAFWSVIGANVVARWTVTLGQAALTLYIVHTVLIAIIFRTLPSGEKIWKVTYELLLAATNLTPAAASLLYAIIAAAISCLILVPLRRRGWILKV